MRYRNNKLTYTKWLNRLYRDDSEKGPDKANSPLSFKLQLSQFADC